MLLPTELKITIISQLAADDMINYLCSSKDSYSIVEKSLQTGWINKLTGPLLDKILIKYNYSSLAFYYLLISGRINYAKKYNKHLAMMFWNLCQFNKGQVYKLVVKLLQYGELLLLDKIVNYRMILNNYWANISDKIISNISNFSFDQCVNLVPRMDKFRKVLLDHLVDHINLNEDNSNLEEFTYQYKKFMYITYEYHDRDVRDKLLCKRFGNRII